VDVNGGQVDPQWIYVDFGTRVSVTRVRILWQDACAIGYQFQISDNAANWTLMNNGAVVNDLPGLGNVPTSWTGATDTQNLGGVGRYLRVFGTVRCRPQYGYSIWEMQVFGTRVSVCPDGGL
jgi:hypothetical protein